MRKEPVAVGVRSGKSRRGIPRRMLLAGMAAVLTLLSACSSSVKPRTPHTLQYELVSPQEQSLEALRAAELRFNVDMGEDQAAWTRANYFFDKYAHSKSVSEELAPVWKTRISSAGGGGAKYLYKVEKILAKEGFNYSVSCNINPSGKPPGSPGAADLNARNLARFIREGRLELDLLER